MGATTTLVTVQEFLALPEPEGHRIELIGGEVVSMPRAGYPHEVTKSNLIQILAVWLVQHRDWKLFSETAFELDEYNSPIPDLILVAMNRIRPGTKGLIRGVPDVAIEVVSSETATHLENKLELYFGHGAKSVWVAFPQQRVVRTFDAMGQSKKFEQNQILEDQAVLPGFQVPVAAIFEGV